jgi:hypothetical protein
MEGGDLAVDALQDRLGDPSLWHKMSENLEADAAVGAGLAATAIEDTFAQLRIRVPIHYEPQGEDPRLTAPTPTEPRITIPLPSEPSQEATTSTAGAAAIRAAAATSTQRSAVYIDGREAGYAILPHLGGILEYHGVR